MVSTPTDLNELDRLRAAATQGEWIAEPDEPRGIMCGDFYITQCYRSPGRNVDRSGQSNRDLIVALVNAYPAMAAELRELRAREESRCTAQKEGPKP